MKQFGKWYWLLAKMRGNWCTIAKVENNFHHAFGNNVFFSKRRHSVNLPNGVDDLLHGDALRYIKVAVHLSGYAE